MKSTIFSVLFICAAALSVSAQKSTSEIMAQAMEKAEMEQKHILVKFEASWCVWCKRMTKQLNDPAVKDYFDQNYIITPLVVLESSNNKNLENKGSLDFLTKFNGEKAGLPFFVILNAKGELVEDSFNDQGQNLGCPASAEEVDTFLKILETTSNLSEKDAKAVKEVFTLKD
ncbi:thioredoxin family protein [Nonlabens xiamenensis]|uniref:thioredoxin family protein n=1 Tax=Nonlabens xiamenensis TaxID=2341043 RepID=UPI000F60A839|nr:thioredoxin family protein [Nonlabens xiamenensis]